MMINSKEELIKDIEIARQRLDESIDERQEYTSVYEYSVKLDQLIEQYIVSGY